MKNQKQRQLTTTDFRTLKHTQHGISPPFYFFIIVRVSVLWFVEFF